ncbi:MAG: alpha/beta fold hydrolase [Dehalococcoidia bacterium]
MNPATESFIETPRGKFRALSWGDGAETVLFLHGLSGVAEVWIPTVSNLPDPRRYVAIDQRGHGQTTCIGNDYSAAAMVADTEAVIAGLGVRPHLVGHSMGARIAMLLAARRPETIRSAVIVDIGPDKWQENIESTRRGVESRPEKFASADDLFAFAFRNRTPTDLDKQILLARMEPHRDGTLTWRASQEALIACVTAQRSRNYWADWRRISMPALFIHGGASNEVPLRIAEKMRAANPGVGFERFEGVGHNIPLIAPDRLAMSLERHWQSAKGARA